MDAPKLDALAYSKTEPQHHHAAFTQADIDAHLAVLPDWRYVAADVTFPRGRIVKNFDRNAISPIAAAALGVGIAWPQARELLGFAVPSWPGMLAGLLAVGAVVRRSRVR